MSEKVRCEICGFEGDWEDSDSVHGTMWGCDRCDKFFCAKCFIDKLGKDSYKNMLRTSTGDYEILCPDCYAEEIMEVL